MKRYRSLSALLSKRWILPCIFAFIHNLQYFCYRAYDEWTRLQSLTPFHKKDERYWKTISSMYAEIGCSLALRLRRLVPQEAHRQHNRSLRFLLFFHSLKVTIRWSVYNTPISVEARTVAWTIPSLLQAIPTYDAPKVWTHG